MGQNDINSPARSIETNLNTLPSFNFLRKVSIETHDDQRRRLAQIRTHDQQTYALILLVPEATAFGPLTLPWWAPILVTSVLWRALQWSPSSQSPEVPV